MTNRFMNLIFALLLAFNALALASGHVEHMNSDRNSAVKIDAATRNTNNSLRRRISDGAVPPSPIEEITTHAQEKYTIADTYTSTQNKQRRTKDVEEILSGMAHKDPTEWEATEWVCFLLFISLFGWIACCLCTMCCCGRGRGSNLLGWLCFWEICCRDGRDLDACCDTYICT